MRHWLLSLPFLLSACGDRSQLALPRPNEPLLADASPNHDAETLPDAYSCAAPWLIFTLITTTDAGAGTSELYGLRSDGTGGHVLALPQASLYPSVSPDDLSLLYANNDASKLFAYRLLDHTTTTLATTGTVGHGAMSADGQTVVYGDGIAILTIGVGGGSQRFLFPNPISASVTAGYPVFLGSTSTVLFATSGALNSISLDGSGFRTLLTVDATNGPEFPNPALSPDSLEVAAVVRCASDSVPGLRVYSVASLPQPCAHGQLLTTTTETLNYYDPAWGPTGLLAFSESRDIMVVDPRDGSVRNATTSVTTDKSAAVSPTWASGCVDLP
ncbi:MAG: hypothetical protein ACHREM_03345 [Polyangiales bacterium]